MKHTAMGMLMLGLTMATGCASSSLDRWTAVHVATLEGFAVPESAAIDTASGQVYVSNIDAASSDDYWTCDGNGSIAKLSLDEGDASSVARSTFAQHAAHASLHSPKGLAVAGSFLWAADNRHLRRYPLFSPTFATSIEVPGAERLNDVLLEDGVVYVSDTAAGVVHRVGANGEVRAIPAPPAVNGITFLGSRLLAVSWSEHDIYDLDHAGDKLPRAWKLARHFKNLDGIEPLEDGSVIVSDFTGNAVWLVTNDGKELRRLIEIESPADIGLDRQRRRLIVPQFMSNRVAIYDLRRN